nr:low temperature requirement protein A [Fructilactobacillus florum]
MHWFFCGSFIVLLLSLIVNEPFKLILLIAALVLNCCAIFFANSKLEQEYQRINMNYELKDSLLERYGLMTMIALGEMIAGLYGMADHIEPKVLFEFAMGIVFAAMIAAVYYQVIGELHVKMKSPIQVMGIRWLFLLEIYLIVLDSILLQLTFEENKYAFKLALVIILFFTLLVMRIIQALTSDKIPDSTAGLGFFYC